MVEYATALVCLSDVGCREAKIAWRLLKSEIEKNQASPVKTVLKGIEREEITPPLRLDPGARWKMDAFGLLALELLLWVWQARLNPSMYGGYGDCARLSLRPFNDESAKEWWGFIRWIMTTFYPRPQQVAELRRLVTALSYKGDTYKEYAYIVRKLRERLESFAIPDQVTTAVKGPPRFIL